VSVVVVDDGSALANVNILQKEVCPRFPNVLLKHNKTKVFNAGVARNIALDNLPLGTKWVIFADADDEFIKPTFKKLIDQLKLDPSADLLFFNCLAKHESKQLESKRCDSYRKLIQSWPHSEPYIAYRWPVPWGKAIKVDKLLKESNIRFGSRLASNDMEFSTKLALATSRIDVFTEDTYICLESSGSLTATLTAPKALDRLKAHLSCNRMHHENNIDFVHYSYGIKFFLKAFPLIIKRCDFRVVVSFLKNIFLALRMNAKGNKVESK
jgi:glycosyltransferase involved in cell wall biosynthesis